MVIDHGTITTKDQYGADRSFQVQSNLSVSDGTCPQDSQTSACDAIWRSDSAGNASAEIQAPLRMAWFDDRDCRDSRGHRGPYHNRRRLECNPEMKLLLDTHIWLWNFLAPDRLSHQVDRTINDARNELWVSPLSTWEIVLLHEKGRL